MREIALNDSGITCKFCTFSRLFNAHTVGVKKNFRFDITKRNGVSVPFLLCRNGTDCKRNGLSVPFLLFFAVPFNAARSNNACAWSCCKGFYGSQNDQANRLSASRLLRNLALQLLGPAINHRTYIAGVWPRRVLPLQCVSCKLERFFLLMQVALVAISSLYGRTESARYRPTSRACLQSGKDRNGTSVS